MKMPPRGSASGPFNTRHAMTCRAPAHLHSMLGVEADDDAGAAVDLAVDPDLAVVVDVRLEPHAGARQRDAPDRRGYLDGDPVPREGEAHRAALADIAAALPAGIVVICESRGAREELGATLGIYRPSCFSKNASAFGQESRSACA